MPSHTTYLCDGHGCCERIEECECPVVVRIQAFALHKPVDIEGLDVPPVILAALKQPNQRLILCLGCATKALRLTDQPTGTGGVE
jgi:hypothetical protein